MMLKMKLLSSEGIKSPQGSFYSKVRSPRNVSFASLSEEQVEEKFHDFDYQKALKRATKKMKLQTRLVNGTLHTNTFLGHELVAALIGQKVCAEASEALYVAEKLLVMGMIRHTTERDCAQFRCTLMPYALAA